MKQKQQFVSKNTLSVHNNGTFPKKKIEKVELKIKKYFHSKNLLCLPKLLQVTVC